MNRARSILRMLYLLAAIALVENLNRKTNDKADSIANFKYKMIQKLQTDSLNSKQKINLLVNETTKFVDDSAHVRNGVSYLMLLLAAFGVTELAFLLLVKRRGRQGL